LTLAAQGRFQHTCGLVSHASRAGALLVYVASPMQASTIIATLVGGAAILVWRIRETQRPVTAKKILIPPLGMTTGFSMFLVPQTRVPFTWGLAAFLAGALFLCYPLVLTSKLTKVGDQILLKRSPAFLVILLGLVVVRLAARGYIEQYIDTVQTGSLFFLLAYGMLLPWRIAMYLRYRSLTRGS
jgi:membrane protein CcdC involved in cytochrome C biogenesis